MDTTTAPINGNDFDAVADNLILDRVDSSLEAESKKVVDDADAQEEQAEFDAADDAEEIEASPSDDDEDVEDDAALDEDTNEQLYTVKVHGKEQQVTLDELRRGYSGQQAIRQGFDQLAASKKEVEQVYMTLQAETQRVQQLRQAFESGAYVAPPTPPDDNTFKNDPIGYMEAKIEYDRKVAAWQQQQQALQAAEARQQHMSEAARQAHLRQELQALQADIPELADPKRAAPLKQKLIETGLAYSYTPEELDQIIDRRAVRVLHDAMKYREMVGARSEVERRTETVRPVVKPGAKKPAQSSKLKAQQQVKSRMRQTGSVDDVAKFLLS